MKCILFTSVLSGGGAERVLCELANSLSYKHSCILVAAYKTENEYMLLPSVRKEYIDGSASTKNPLKQLVRLRNILKKEKPDICVSFLPQPNFKLLISSIGLPVKKLISVRNDPRKEYSGRMDQLLLRLLYPMAHGIVFQTEDAQAWFSPELQKKSRIIMNQVSARFFNTQRKEEKYYVATGRLNRQKNYGLMIRSFASFAAEYPSAVLKIYGEGELRQELEELICELEMEGNIRLMGASTDVPELLSNAKAFLLSSDFEGMPNGLLEAMAMGLPCVSTDCPCGGPRTVIEDYTNGILVPVGDESAFAEALYELEASLSLREKLGKAARIKALEFHPEHVVQQWENYMKELCT